MAADGEQGQRRWLITGGSGQVGGALRETGLPDGVELILPGRAELDLADPPDLDALIAANGAELIINCGAYTAVDRAESEAELAMAVNGRAPALLAEAAARAAIPIIHLSTDYVFDGQLAGRAYREDDRVAPANAYGRTKLAGERGVLDSAARAVVLRTAWVLSPFGHNFLKTMLRLGQERDELRVVADQLGNPTSAHAIAEAIMLIGARLTERHDAPTGIFHFVNAGEASWHALAEHIFARAARHGHPVPRVKAIATADYPTPAARPTNSRLDTARIKAAYNITPDGWREAVDDIVDRLCDDRRQTQGTETRP